MIGRAGVLLAMMLAMAPPVRAQERQRIAEWAQTGDGQDWVAAARERRTRSMGEATAHMDLARALYFRAVESESALAEGVAVLDTLDRMWPGGAGPSHAVRDAYRGAFTVLRAKHGWWPPDRLRHTRTGLALLDRAVAAAPADPEIRYLRLMSGFYLPGLFGRGNEVRQDLAALADFLPEARGMYPTPVFDTVVRFVLREAELSDDARAALEALLPWPAPSGSASSVPLSGSPAGLPSRSRAGGSHG